MAPFYGWASTTSRLQSLRGGVTSVMKDIFMEQLFVLISASVCTANQLTGFYIRATLALNGLINPA